MAASNVYISVTDSGRQLIIDGPLDLFQKFLTSIEKRDILPGISQVKENLITKPAIKAQAGSKPPAAA
jgi:hypothetical protein